MPKIKDYDYYNKLAQRISEYNITDNFIFITEPLDEAVSLWKMSDIVIRATNTDGNSLTILEALSIGVVVIASNCVERPNDVVLFENRNVDDLVNKVKLVLNSLDKYKSRINPEQYRSNANDFIQLYKTFLDGDK